MMASRVPFPTRQYLFSTLGILLSVVIPILRQALPTINSSLLASPTSAVTYLVVGVFSLLTALIVIAVGGASTPSWEWYTALLAGYAWDSTLQKIVHG